MWVIFVALGERNLWYTTVPCVVRLLGAWCGPHYLELSMLFGNPFPNGGHPYWETHIVLIISWMTISRIKSVAVGWCDNQWVYVGWVYTVTFLYTRLMDHDYASLMACYGNYWVQ